MKCLVKLTKSFLIGLVKIQGGPCRMGVLSFLAAGCLLASSSIVSAASYSWNATSGDWSTASNWSDNVEPTTSDNVYIQNGGTATSAQAGEACYNLYVGSSGTSNTGTINVTGGALAVNAYLYLGNDSGSSGTINLNAGQFSAYIDNVGYNGTGLLTQSGGKNTTNYLYLGRMDGSNGTYRLSGTGQLTSTYEYLGGTTFSGSANATGAFNQSGGTNTVTYLLLGCQQGTSGTYELSGGLLADYWGYIGYRDTGTFKQTGGSHTAAVVALGVNNTGASGTYELSGSGTLSCMTEYIGCQGGTGTFTQSGGTNTVTTGNLWLGYGVGSSGTYNLNGGTLVLCGTATIACGSGTAAFNFGSGTLKADGDFSVVLPMTLTGMTATGATSGNANVDTAGHAVAFSGGLSGCGGLNKLGDGTLTLGNANPYDGDTNIYAGTLALDSTGSIAHSSVLHVRSGATFDVSALSSGFSLANAQTLKGGGEVVGAVATASGSRVAPGDDGVGTLTFANDLTLGDGTLLEFELGSTSNSDLISMTQSTLTLADQEFSDFAFTALNGFGAGTYTLIDAGAIQGSLGSALTGMVGGLSAALSISGNSLVLTVVPEPGTFALLICGWTLALVGVWRRRRS